jgi:hypothetical protein
VKSAVNKLSQAEVLVQEEPKVEESKPAETVVQEKQET